MKTFILYFSFIFENFQSVSKILRIFIFDFLKKIATSFVQKIGRTKRNLSLFCNIIFHILDIFSFEANSSSFFLLFRKRIRIDN